MATKSPVECPLCHKLIDHGQTLERHLLREHRKRKLAKFVVAEAEAREEGDISE